MVVALQGHSQLTNCICWKMLSLKTCVDERSEKSSVDFVLLSQDN